LFNPTGGTIFDPSVLPFALASTASAILAWLSGAASHWQLAIYAAWCLTCQALAVFLLVLARSTDMSGLRSIRRLLCNQSKNGGSYAASSYEAHFWVDAKSPSIKTS
jgi:hypothetical protein